MGHLGNLKQEYRELVDRLDASTIGMPEPSTEEARAGWQEILEILFSPEEAAIAARLPVAPADLDQVAKKVGLPAPELKPVLDRLADKGIVVDLVHPETGETKYVLSPPVIGFFEFSMMRAKDSIPKKRLAEALEAYKSGDDTFAREVFGGETLLGRALVYESALAQEELPDVLTWERATALIEGADKIGVSLCYCRHKAEHLGKKCDAPMNNCLTLNSGADFVVRRGFGRQVDRAEALKLLDEARSFGLVHIADNVQHKPTYICNCCGCCCGQLAGINEWQLKAINPSSFWAVSPRDKCSGCAKCSRACPIGAIAMKPERVTGKRKNKLYAEVSHEDCIGCGVCIASCKKGYMHMEKRQEQPHVPYNSIEKFLRMTLERGHLPHVLYHQGSFRGLPFLRKAFEAMCSFPPAERALAAEQLRSRFVKFALKNVKDPSGA